MDILVVVSYLLSPILLATLSWVSVQVALLISARVKSARLRVILYRLNDAIFTAVREVQQSMVDAVKKTGSFDGAAREAAKAAAMATVKSHIGPQGISEMQAALGLTDEQVDQILGARIEAAVHDLKAGTLAAPAEVN